MASGEVQADEMAIRKHIEWDGHKFKGYTDYGTGVDDDDDDDDDDDELPIVTEAWVFMSTRVSGIYVKKRKNGNSSRHHVLFIYRVKDSHGQLNRVCSKSFVMFSEFRKDAFPLLEEIGRGKHGNYKHKTSDSEEKSVSEHIKKFPLYASHYCRNKLQKKYIKAVKSVAEMYRLYKEEREALNLKCELRYLQNHI
ncbi:hypothetical protein ANN_24516 [Periplaneta americana]|uniref:Transposable element P transposase-like RNase H domain-containing protein n=1 Tax=Periplaneta americana TaxID=6978 RepID=A0ABQ8S3M1_PERAM|nr:hypothetical protein ANN_24516 [Periplaneta americana]